MRRKNVSTREKVMPNHASVVAHRQTATGSHRSDVEAIMSAEKKTERAPLISELLLLLLKLVFIAGFAGLVVTFLFGISQMPNESMSPSVREGDLVLYYRLQKDYSAKDLIVVNSGKEKEVRRVVAVAGDTVDFTEDGLMINGFYQAEDRIYTETLPFREGITYPVTLSDGQVFVLGDNREQSEDSRIYGPVDIETGTEGEAITIIRRRNF